MGFLEPTIAKAKPDRLSPGAPGAGRPAVPVRRFLLILFCIGTIFLAGRSEASAETRSLKIYQVHTHERAIITYKRNGRYVPAGLKKLDYILRDWRKNKEIKMDPRLFDLLWEVYQKSGSRDYIHIICGYRTGNTNSMLRGRSRASGVAKKSQHILGKAIDFYIPDVPLAKLRAIGMKFQVGGVGFYPNSGSPFVHMDTGYVRAWPRMTRKQLVQLFPNGHTLHLPRDGKPLPGYQQALASYKRRVTSNSIMVAGGSASGSRSSGGNLLASLFGGGDDGLSAEDTVQENPQLHQIERKAMAPRSGTASQPSGPALPETPPLPGVRPVAVAMATPDVEQADTKAASDGSSNEDRAPQYPDLTAYAIPIPQFAPDRGNGSASSDAGKAPALVASADTDAAAPQDSKPQHPARTLPVPDLRPELVAFAPVEDSAPPAAVAMPALAPSTVVPRTRPRDDSKKLRPSAIAAAARKDPDRGKVLMAALTPPADNAVSSDVPVQSFENVTDVRGGRIGSGDAGAARNSTPALTRAMIARWARANDAGPSKAVKGSRASLHSAVETMVDGHSVDPQRFAAVSVYFPND